jgi:hypothetical protein
LKNYSPSADHKFWCTRFVHQVSEVLPRYDLKKITCIDILLVDDTLPMVVQLKSGDQSESHAFCIFDGCIYDSASRFVLQKNEEALNWCCRSYGFECHLRVYRLEPKAKKKMKRRRYA